jgi:DNA-directed RNA polymerase specialized sigma24 family protein
MIQSQTERRSSAAPLLPTIRRDALPTVGERRLTWAARRATKGDHAWRDAIYFAVLDWLEPRVQRWARLVAACDGSWDLDDVRQEAYLVVVALVANWDGTADFFDYLARAFPAELARAVQRGHRRPGKRVATWHLDPLHDGSAAAEESLALLETIAADLPALDGWLVLARVRDRAGWDAIAAHLGQSRRTVLRHWSRLAARLREELTTDD